ncbi:hypothetical protein [Hoeflea sp.]|uniref:hypothetical protein n=1 Tax=Hoeflea sp. TaxID=1940281 RepID=UPI0019CF3D41|nr:hypothetical protein [Hoeflea sp.]MBC7284548.1 hypothetical protein [Hoeflea sp.]
MIRFSISILCLLMLGLAPARGQVMTSIPSAAAGDPKVFWSAVMEEFYGAYNKRAKCWMGVVGGEKLCMRPHLLSSVVVDGDPIHFVAMAGYVPGPDGGRADCHACGGKLGLVILKETGSRLALVARNDLSTDVGSWGSVPPEEAFRVVAFGKGNHGWLMEFFYTGQGYTEGGVGVFGAIGDKIVDLGFISTHSDNAGTCGDGLGMCYRYSYEILSDPAASDSRFGDLIARKLESSKPDAPDTIRVPFSQQELKYQMPPALEAALGK